MITKRQWHDFVQYIDYLMLGHCDVYLRNRRISMGPGSTFYTWDPGTTLQVRTVWKHPDSLFDSTKLPDLYGAHEVRIRPSSLFEPRVIPTPKNKKGSYKKVDGLARKK